MTLTPWFLASMLSWLGLEFFDLGQDTPPLILATKAAQRPHQAAVEHVPFRGVRIAGETSRAHRQRHRRRIPGSAATITGSLLSGQTGRHLLDPSLTAYDPSGTSWRRR